MTKQQQQERTRKSKNNNNHDKTITTWKTEKRDKINQEIVTTMNK